MERDKMRSPKNPAGIKSAPSPNKKAPANCRGPIS